MFTNKLAVLGLGLCLLVPPIPLIAQQQGSFEKKELSGSDAQELKRSLSTTYAGYESEIASAHVKYQIVRLECLKYQITRDQVIQQVKQLQLSQIETLPQEILKSFGKDLFESGRTDLWIEKELLVSGKDWISLGGHHDHYVQGDLHVIIEESNNQAKCYDRGSCRIWTENLTWFRTLPPQKVFEEDVRFFRVGDSIESHFQGTPTQPNSWLSLNADGLLIEHLHLANTRGEPAKESFYQQFTTFPGGIQFPTVKIDVSYSQGFLNRLTATIVTEAQFNVDIPDSKFIHKRPAKSSWVDFRNDQQNGSYFSNRVPDVLEFFGSRRNLARPVTGKPNEVHSSTITTWIFMINGLMLILVGVYLWRRVPS